MIFFPGPADLEVKVLITGNCIYDQPARVTWKES